MVATFIAALYIHFLLLCQKCGNFKNIIIFRMIMSAIGNGSIFNAIPKAKVALSALDPIFASEDDQRKNERRMVLRSTSMIFTISTSFHFWLSVLMNHQKEGR